jgi:hypothetical protein
VKDDTRSVRPLVSPVFEYRMFGALQIATSAVFLAVAGLRGGDGGAPLVPYLGLAAFFGLGMYVTAYRRGVKKAAADPAPAPTSERESAWRTWKRGLVSLALLAPVYLVAVAGRGEIFVAAILAGNGAAMWWVGTWLARREREAGRLLREPRYRWRGEDSGFGGRGIMDARDFYVDAQRPSGVAP